MKARYLAFFAALPLFLISCASTPPVVQRATLPQGAQLAVISFRDCTIAGQEDCDGSGQTAAGIFAEVLSGKFNTALLSRPVSADDPLSDDAAVAYAKSKGYAYVLNGEVTEFYRVAPFTFRTERAGVSVRILRVSDGSVMAFFSQRTHSKSNLTTPQHLIEKMAEHVRDSLK